MMSCSSLFVFVAVLLFIENPLTVNAQPNRGKRSGNQVEIDALLPIAYNQSTADASLNALKNKLSQFSTAIGQPIPSSGFSYTAVNQDGKLAGHILVDESVKSCASIVQLLNLLKVVAKSEFVSAKVLCPDGTQQTV